MAADALEIDDSRIDTRYFSRFEKVTCITRTGRGITVTLEGIHNEFLRVDVIREDILRIKVSRGGQFDEEPTFAVCADLDAPVPHFNVEEDENRVRVCTGRITLTVERAPFSLSAYRVDGSVIFEDARGSDGLSWAYATLNDEFIVKRACRPEDAFYGLGEKTGRLNRKGRDYTMWNTDVLNPNATGEFKAALKPDDPRANEISTEFDPYYISIPFFYHLSADSSAAAGFFIDNGYRSHFDFSPRYSYAFHFHGGQYTEYIFAGPSMAEILEGYTWLTGRIPPPPLWALGYHQCRWYAYTQESFLGLAAQLRERRIPCDALWLDIDYMDGYRVFTWNKATFPDAPAMLADLSASGFRTITIIDPGIKFEPGYAVFDQALKRDILCKTEGGAVYIGQVWPGMTAFPDFVTQEARDWWGELNAEHVRSGLAGIWNDMNEPATGDIKPDAMRFDKGRYSHARYHNQYALLMAMGTTDGLLAAMPDRRTFVLSRAGFSGIQRYAANWMGDNISCWEHLWMSMPMALGLGLSGQPFVGADIGGFGGNTNAELFLRWIECGALTPFCRNHNAAGMADQYPWSFGEEVETVARAALELRYRLMPYLYTAFMLSVETGTPIQRPLVFSSQSDRFVWDIDDQYLLGDHLLVAPVYVPGVVSRSVYLPEGDWYNCHTGECLPGKRWIDVPALPGQIPLFAHAGAVIPKWPEAPATTAGYHPGEILLNIFIPQADGETISFLHEDDGLSFAFRKGSYISTTFILRRVGNQLTLDGRSTGGGFAEFGRKSFTLIFFGAAPAEIEIDGQVILSQEGRIDLPNRGQDFQAVFSL